MNMAEQLDVSGLYKRCARMSASQSVAAWICKLLMPFAAVEQ